MPRICRHWTVDCSSIFYLTLPNANQLSTVLSWFFLRVYCTSVVAHLTLSAEPPEQFVTLELGLLVRNDAWHLEDKPRFRLFVEHRRIVRMHHARKGGGVVHHHLVGPVFGVRLASVHLNPGSIYTKVEKSQRWLEGGYHYCCITNVYPKSNQIVINLANIWFYVKFLSIGWFDYFVEFLTSHTVKFRAIITRDKSLDWTNDVTSEPIDDRTLSTHNTNCGGSTL